MDNSSKLIKVRARLVVIKDGKVLVTYDSVNDYYYYLGGKLEFGETLGDCCRREIREECGADAVFTFNKILYVRDFILPAENEHSLELFILGEVNKGEELEHYLDPEDAGKKWLTWLPLDKLPANLKPVTLTAKLLADYQAGFPKQGEYVGAI